MTRPLAPASTSLRMAKALHRTTISLRQLAAYGYRLMLAFGLDFRKLLRSVVGIPAYCRDFVRYRSLRGASGPEFAWAMPFPCLSDRFEQSGLAKGHYFHQDLLVARRIFSARPAKHIDIGSRVDGFVAHVASFRRIVVLDIRPLSAKIPNIEFLQADLMQDLPADLVMACDSLSCLHALEHFGLGRYGDPVDPAGFRKGFAAMTRMLVPGGTLHLSVPIGVPRIEFNAHRVFSPAQILDLSCDDFEAVSFSYVDDAGDLRESVPLTELVSNPTLGCRYGCGVFEFRKRPTIETADRPPLETLVVKTASTGE